MPGSQVAEPGSRARSLAPAQEAALLAALRSGDEAAFVTLVDAHSPAMLRVARVHVRSAAVAEEVVQEAWLAVLRSLDRFEGRSSLRTWLFAVLANCARKRAAREGRSTPFADLRRELAEPGPDEERFFPPDHPRWAGAWSTAVRTRDDLPEERLLSAETLAAAREAVRTLPELQRACFALRDVEGWSGPEVARELGISEANQRVLLHRARAKVRLALERHLDGEDAA